MDHYSCKGYNLPKTWKIIHKIKMATSPPPRKKFSKFMEGIWLGLAAVSLVTWIISKFKESEGNDSMLLIIAGVSLLMYLLRKYLRNHPPLKREPPKK